MSGLEPLKVTAIGVRREEPRVGDDRLTPDILCWKLTAWAEAAGMASTVVSKSDLLGRLVYGGERGPSQTRCPVHKGVWSGCHFGWPGSEWVGEGGRRPAAINPRLQEWWDAGCRCATHLGSTCTTGWNPDANCCLP